MNHISSLCVHVATMVNQYQHTTLVATSCCRGLHQVSCDSCLVLYCVTTPSPSSHRLSIGESIVETTQK